MVAVGFKAKWSASFLVTLLSVFNVFINNWWSVHSAHPQRDFLKYDLCVVSLSVFCFPADVSVSRLFVSSLRVFPRILGTDL
jgi:uncharacterized membrane protein YphA (DoxX/SURF4 family)